MLFNHLSGHVVSGATVAVLLALTVAAGGCTPTVNTRGNLVSDTSVQRVQPMVSTRADIAQIWGPPTTVAPFDPNVWYYIGETTSQAGIFEPEVQKRRMFRVTFDAGDTIAEIAELDPADGREIEIVDRHTPTAGKEFTAFQQFVGNLGKFNTNEAPKGRAGP